MCTDEKTDEEKVQFNLNWLNWQKQNTGKKDHAGIKRPILTISNISNSGKVTIKFDQPLIPVKNPDERLHAPVRKLQKEEDLKSAVEIFVVKLDDQQQSDLDLKWTVSEFSESQMSI